MIDTKMDLFNYSRAVNKYILDKYENNRGVDILDYYIYEMTTYDKALMTQALDDERGFSLSNALIFKNLIEAIAVIRMYEAGDLENNNEVLLANKIKLGLNHSNVPFLNGTASIDYVVEKYLNQVYEDYNVLKLFLSPHDLLLSHTKNEKKTPIMVSRDWTEHLTDYLYSLSGYILENVYKDIRNVKVYNAIIDDFDIIDKNKNKKEAEYFECTTELRGKLFELGDYINKACTEGAKGYLYKEMGYFIYDMALYTIFGLDDVALLLLHEALELLALDGLEYNGGLTAGSFRPLINIHTLIRELELIGGVDINLDVYLDNAYRFAKEDHFNMTKDEFIEHFYKPLGFIKENIDINTMVENYLFKNSLSHAEALELLSFYKESKALDKPNGYLLEHKAHNIDFKLDSFINNSINKFIATSSMLGLVNEDERYILLCKELLDRLQKLGRLQEKRNELYRIMKNN